MLSALIQVTFSTNCMPGSLVSKANSIHDGQRERGQRDDQRDDLVDGRPAAADEQHEQHAGERQERDDARDREADLVAPAHVSVPQTQARTTTSTSMPREDVQGVVLHAPGLRWAAGARRTSSQSQRERR